MSSASKNRTDDARSNRIKNAIGLTVLGLAFVASAVQVAYYHFHASATEDGEQRVVAETNDVRDFYRLLPVAARSVQSVRVRFD